MKNCLKYLGIFFLGYLVAVCVYKESIEINKNTGVITSQSTIVPFVGDKGVETSVFLMLFRYKLSEEEDFFPVQENRIIPFFRFEGTTSGYQLARTEIDLVDYFFMKHKIYDKARNDEVYKEFIKILKENGISAASEYVHEKLLEQKRIYVMGKNE